MLIAHETTQWYETLSEAERRECADELTDAYLAALSAGDWEAFQIASRRWMERAAAKQLVNA